MALPLRLFIRNCVNIQVTKPVHRYVVRNYSPKYLQHGNLTRVTTLDINLSKIRQPEHVCVLNRGCATKSNDSNKDKGIPEAEPPKKIGLVQRFKQMYRDYWYVLLPVHVTTSAVWIGGLYYAVRSGVDVIALMESLGVSNKIIEPLKDSSAGYFALTFALYKIVAPLRYAVTIGGTTYAIRRLTAIGWIKPVPSTQRIKEIIQEKREDLSDRFHESKIHYQGQMKDKRDQVMEEMRRYKMDMKNMKDKLKKM